MEWLFKPKVQLGLLVNFIFVMFTLVSSSAGSHRQVTRVVVEERHGLAAVESNSAEPRPVESRPAPPAATVEGPFRYVQLPPRVGPSQATSRRDQNTGELSVYPTREFTLVNKDGRTLTLWPIFYVSSPSITPPRKVLLRFTSNAPKQVYGGVCELKIGTESDSNLWPARKVASDITLKVDTKSVVETMAADIPYPIFLKLVTSKRVTLRVGGEEVTLTESQLSALRDMQRCVQDGIC